MDHDVSAALGERYRPERLIATGGMGEVWAATDTVLGRPVACKVLKREYADDAGFRERFINEARSAAQLQHPGIAGVFDFGEKPGERPFLVMELIEGPTLTAVLHEGPLPPERARDVVAQVAEALGAAHAIGLVHRDVKPGNILLCPDGRVKLADFGIARAGDGVALTKTGEIIGTPSYISPEQAEGRTATAASDVYSLGCVLYECLTGEKPFLADGPVATALAHLREPVPELTEDVPRDLADVTRTALAKDPAERYPDGAAFAASLRGEAARLAGESTQVLALPPEGVSRLTSFAPQPTTSWWRRRWAQLLVGALVLFIATALVIGALADGGPRQADNVPTVDAPQQVRVVKAQYVGKKVVVVRAALRALGLETVVRTKANPGGETAGTVADLSPTGPVAPKTVIVLQVWGVYDPPEPAQTDDKGGDNKHKGKGDGKKGKGKG